MARVGITIFTTFKPFRGDMARIQRNAIRSWLALEPRPEILVFGADEGVADVCGEFGLRHIREVLTAPSGAPYLDDLFMRAQQLASNEILCYVNGDIILLSDFMWAVSTAYRHGGGAILIATPRNLKVSGEIDPARPGWEAELRQVLAEESPQPTRNGADVFAFPKRLRWRLPSAIVGRFWWDNALMWLACVGPLPAVDLTQALVVVHQDHAGTSHRSEFSRDTRLPLELAFNRAAIPWWQRFTWRGDVPYELRHDGRIVRRYLLPRARLYGVVSVRQLSSLEIRTLERTFVLRRRLGLYRWWRKASA